VMAAEAGVELDEQQSACAQSATGSSTLNSIMSDCI